MYEVEKFQLTRQPPLLPFGFELQSQQVYPASKIMPLVCFAERNKEGAARAAGDIRVVKQTSGVI